MYDARAIANAVLEAAWQTGKEVTQIDVQKICYFLHGHHLRDHGRPLIKSEFEAWDYGPVQSVLYRSFKKFGKYPITEKAVAFDPVRRCEKSIEEVRDNAARDTIEKYLPVYLNFESFELVDITHAEGTPWSRTVEDAITTVNVGMRIKNEAILYYFEGIERSQEHEFEQENEEGEKPSGEVQLH